MAKNELAANVPLVCRRKLHTFPGVHDGNTIVNDHIAALDIAVGNEREI